MPCRAECAASSQYSARRQMERLTDVSHQYVWRSTAFTPIPILDDSTTVELTRPPVALETVLVSTRRPSCGSFKPSDRESDSTMPDM